MKITPLEIKRQQFKKAMRGYDTIEVDTFLEMLSNEFELMIKKNKEFGDKIVEYETQLRDYRNIEKTLQETLRQAQETSNKSIENSKREAEIILQEAQLKASQVVDRARMDFARAKEEIANLRARKEALMSRIKALLTSELDLIKALDIEDEDFLKDEPLKGTGRNDIEIEDILKKL
jgi:cell division initiation protein